jgi:hypothetical protein
VLDLDQPIGVVVVEEPLRFFVAVGVVAVVVITAVEEALEDAPVLVIVGVRKDVLSPGISALFGFEAAGDGEQIAAPVIGEVAAVVAVVVVVVAGSVTAGNMVGTARGSVRPNRRAGASRRQASIRRGNSGWSGSPSD